MELNITSKSNPFGDTTAENDKKMLSNAFIETADFRTLVKLMTGPLLLVDEGQVKVLYLFS